MITTRNSRPRAFENILGCDESWLGMSKRLDTGIPNLDLLTLLTSTATHHSRGLIIFETGLYEQECATHDQSNLQSPTNPSARQLGPPHTLVSLSPPGQRRPMDTADDDVTAATNKLDGHIISPHLIRYPSPRPWVRGLMMTLTTAARHSTRLETLGRTVKHYIPHSLTSFSSLSLSNPSSADRHQTHGSTPQSARPVSFGHYSLSGPPDSWQHAPECPSRLLWPL